MKKIFDIFHFGIIGTGIGAIITTVCLYFMAGEICKTKEFAVWITASAFIGMLTMLMYFDKLNLITATSIHFVFSFGIVFSAALICGYGGSIIEIIKNILPLFLIIYFVIYITILLISKSNEKKINNSLKEKNNH